MCRLHLEGAYRTGLKYFNLTDPLPVEDPWPDSRVSGHKASISPRNPREIVSALVVGIIALIGVLAVAITQAVEKSNFTFLKRRYVN